MLSFNFIIIKVNVGLIFEENHSSSISKNFSIEQIKSKSNQLKYKIIEHIKVKFIIIYKIALLIPIYLKRLIILE
jgi:hypothetical protein